jgi:hypothetical protein
MVYTNAGSIKYVSVLPCLVFTIIAFSASLIAIFLYRKRMIQVRFCIYNSLILVGYQGWILNIFFSGQHGISFSITAVFPVIAAILLFIASRYIMRDEQLVRATSRLRKK